jgi:hypothetical protein
VEGTFVWLGLSRRFSKDYERLPETAETMVYGAMSRTHAAHAGAGDVEGLSPPRGSHSLFANLAISCVAPL